MNLIEEIFQLYKDYGNYDYIGEPISQTEHMVLAATVAEADNCDDECILAAFFHDIGHLLGHKNSLQQMDSFGTKDHDTVGADYLRSKNFPEKVCKLVQNHVLAKRYLVSTDPSYYDKLSEASKMTFTYQGKLMTPQEITDFENDPLTDLYVKFRNWEELAKLSPDRVNSLQKYKDLCFKLLTD